uniref:non-specific serine/threonine protein kinase n=1 Tax=Strongyloides stercoralis TaxID=6248 RepID=A0A0K0DU76_STRER
MNGGTDLNESWEDESSKILLQPQLTKKLQLSRVKNYEVDHIDTSSNPLIIKRLQLMVITLINWISKAAEPSTRETCRNVLWKFAVDHDMIPNDLDKNGTTIFAEQLHKNILKYFQDKLGDISHFNIAIDHNISINCSQNFLNMGQSKYESDFQECECIGKGGFGSVHRVKNYVDGRYYAVKKVILKNDDSDSVNEALKEVQHLSILEHGGIVRYYHSWIDVVRVKRRKRSSTCRSSSECKIEEINTEEEEENELDNSFLSDDTLNHNTEPSFTSEDDTDVVFQDDDSLVSSRSSSGKGFFRQPENSQGSFTNFSSLDGSTINSNITKSDDTDKVDNEVVMDNENPYYITRSALFIQMELLTTNLEDLLLNKDFRTSVVRKSFNRKAIYTLISALSYIHDMGIIHRDIKSVNIFIKKTKDDWKIKLGDFGLSCQSYLQDHDEILYDKKCKNEVISNIRIYHTKGIGSVNYAPDEQMTSRTYGPEVDIFALGMVFYELLSDFSTRSECYNAFLQLRKTEKLPIEFCKKYPKKSKMIESMVCKDPLQRITAKELLEKMNQTVNVEAFHFILSENDTLKKHLQDLSNELMEEKNKNNELERKLKEMEKRIKLLEKSISSNKK